MDARDQRALSRLRKDPLLGGLVARIGPPRFHEYSRQDLLHNLLEAILAQQLSARAARAIFERFREAQGEGFPDPRKILRTRDETLRRCGFSRAKVEAVKALCRAVLDGALDLEELPRKTDREVVERLTALRGIGPWTAHMALIFALRRPDVWPAADLGLRKGLRTIFGLPALPTPAEAEPMGDRWRPYRSYACWYLWQMNDGG